MLHRPVAHSWSPTELWGALLHHSVDGIALLGPEARIQEWSPGAEKITGYAPGEIVGKPVGFLHTPSQGDFEADGSQMTYDLEHDQITSLRCKDGALRTAYVRARPLHDEGGRLTGTVIFIRDVTGEERNHQELVERERALSEALRGLRRSHEELKATQLQLIQSTKLESLGRLAAGVAHEVKNPLAILLAGVQLLRQRVPGEDREVTETLDDLESAVGRANGIIRHLLDYAASTELRLEPVDVEDLVSTSLHLVNHTLRRRHIRVEREEAWGLPKLQLDRTKIEQVLVNLLINAVDASPDGGTLTVRQSLTQLSQPGPDVGYRKTDVLRVGQTVVVLEIEDEGTGFSPAALEHAFDPFYTTKPPGKGTGLGLAVCRTIVGLHGGSVRLENRPEGGARATLLLRAGQSAGGVKS